MGYLPEIQQIEQVIELLATIQEKYVEKIKDKKKSEFISSNDVRTGIRKRLSLNSWRRKRG